MQFLNWYTRNGSLEFIGINLQFGVSCLLRYQSAGYQDTAAKRRLNADTFFCDLWPTASSWRRHFRSRYVDCLNLSTAMFAILNSSFAVVYDDRVVSPYKETSSIFVTRLTDITPMTPFTTVIISVSTGKHLLTRIAQLNSHECLWLANDFQPVEISLRPFERPTIELFLRLKEHRKLFR